MDSNQMGNSSLDIRKTKFTMLKEQQCTLNMRIRLAMQLHDTQTQADLEVKLKEVLEQINHIVDRKSV
uniref:hypothetical protein n=2 Tax=Sporofaciens musculi TaxID=2681861 RepID=UPI00256FBFCC